MIFRHINPEFRKRHPGNGIILDTSFLELDWDQEAALVLMFISSGVPLEYKYTSATGNTQWIPVPAIETQEQLRCFTEDPWHPL